MHFSPDARRCLKIPGTTIVGRNAFIAFLCVVAFTGCAEEPASEDKPQPVPFEVKGMRIGDKITKEFFDNHCQIKDKLKADVVGSELIKINNKSVFVSYQFDDYKLITVSVVFDSDLYTNLVAVYTEKFGGPPHETEKTTASWITDAGPFIIDKYGSPTGKGFAMLHSPEYYAYSARQKNKDTESLRGKL